MQRASLKLAFLVVLLASASFISPCAVETRHKKCHGHGRHASPPTLEPSSPPAEPPALLPQSVAPSPSALPLPPTEAPALSPDLPPPPPPPPSAVIGVPYGYVAPPPGYQAPPYQIHGCGYPCSDSNDCDWPCTACCYHPTGNTCCYE